MSENKTPAISVIVPVYNVEKFLRRGLESLVNQTMKNFEVILVNDGSTDSSLAIMQEFEKKYPVFRIINKENGGVSSARNAGVNAARGEFIAFMDSDDSISPQYLETLYNAAKSSGADVTCCGFTFYFPKSGKTLKTRGAPHFGIFSMDKPLRWMLSDWTMHYFLWNKLWKRTLFTENNIDFPPIYFEDCATCPRLMFFAKKVAIIKEHGYFYTRHNASILGSMNARKINDYIRSLAIVRNFLEQQNCYHRYHTRYYWYGWKVVITNWFNVLWAHASCRNLKGAGKNLRAVTHSIFYYTGKKFQSQAGVGEFPCPVKQPENKRKHKI